MSNHQLVKIQLLPRIQKTLSNIQTIRAVVKSKPLARTSPTKTVPKTRYNKPVADIIPLIRAVRHARTERVNGKINPTVIRNQKAGF